MRLTQTTQCALLEVLIARHLRPRLQTQHRGLDRLPNINERVTHNLHVPGGTRHGKRLRDDALFLRALDEVVDQDAQAAARARCELTNRTGEVIHAVQRLHHDTLNTQVVTPHFLHELGVVQTLNPDAGGARHPSRGVLHRNRTGTRNRVLGLLRRHRGNNLNGLTLNQVARTQRKVLHAALRVLQPEEQGTADAFSLHDLTHPAVNILNQQAALQRNLTRRRRLAAHSGGV